MLFITLGLILTNAETHREQQQRQHGWLDRISMHTTYIHDDERVEWSEYVKVFCFHQHHRQTKQLVECRAMFSTSATNDTSLPLPQTYVTQTC